MASNERSPRPLIRTQSRDRGASQTYIDSAKFAQRGHDLTYVPGYSDKRIQVEQDLAAGREPSVQLEYRMHWVTANKPSSGAPNAQQTTRFKANGYRAAVWDDAAKGAYGITEMEAHWEKTPDGHIRNGDTLLFVCDADTADRHWEEGRSAIEERSTDDFTSSTLHSAGREFGGGGDLTTSETKHEVRVSK